MTLILTELTQLGIVMAADSTVTYTNHQTGHSYVIPNKAKKLQVIPYLHAGISCWGMGAISNTPTDKWIEILLHRMTLYLFLYSLSWRHHYSMPFHYKQAITELDKPKEHY